MAVAMAVECQFPANYHPCYTNRLALEEHPRPPCLPELEK